MLEAASQRGLERAKLAVSTAWHTEMFARVKKLPDLAERLEEMDRAAHQGPATQESIDRGVAGRRKEMERIEQRRGKQ
jgi:hypothetical protein